jgi:hypothetical protein
VNPGGLLVLTAIFATLILVVQRSELKRRGVSAFIMLIIGSVMWRYGLYVLTRDCANGWKLICSTLPIRQSADSAANATLIQALLLAILINFVFWALIGRYNPVGSSDSITVIGRDG